jgi:hypothetical protein
MPRKIALALATTVAMMPTGSTDVRALTGLASLANAVRDNSPIERLNCLVVRRRDGCPVGLYLTCTLDRRCACISCFAFRRYPDDYHWYRWGYQPCRASPIRRLWIQVSIFALALCAWVGGGPSSRKFSRPTPQAFPSASVRRCSASLMCQAGTKAG